MGFDNYHIVPVVDPLAGGKNQTIHSHLFGLIPVFQVLMEHLYLVVYAAVTDMGGFVGGGAICWQQW